MPIHANSYQSYEFIPMSTNVYPWVPIHINPMQINSRCSSYQFTPTHTSAYRFIPIHTNQRQFKPIQANSHQSVLMQGPPLGTLHARRVGVLLTSVLWSFLSLTTPWGCLRFWGGTAACPSAARCCRRSRGRRNYSCAPWHGLSGWVGVAQRACGTPMPAASPWPRLYNPKPDTLNPKP